MKRKIFKHAMTLFSHVFKQLLRVPVIHSVTSKINIRLFMLHRKVSGFYVAPQGEAFFIGQT